MRLFTSSLMIGPWRIIGPAGPVKAFNTRSRCSASRTAFKLALTDQTSSGRYPRCPCRLQRCNSSGILTNQKQLHLQARSRHPALTNQTSSGRYPRCPCRFQRFNSSGLLTNQKQLHPRARSCHHGRLGVQFHPLRFLFLRNEWLAPVSTRLRIT